MRSRKGGTSAGAKQRATSAKSSPLPSQRSAARSIRASLGNVAEARGRAGFDMLFLIDVEKQSAHGVAAGKLVGRNDRAIGADAALAARANARRGPAWAAKPREIGALALGAGDPDGILGRAERVRFGGGDQRQRFVFGRRRVHLRDHRLGRGGALAEPGLLLGCRRGGDRGGENEDTHERDSAGTARFRVRA